MMTDSNLHVVRVSLDHDVPIDYDKLASAIGESSLASDIADSIGQNECKPEAIAKLIDASDIAEHVDTDDLAQSLADSVDMYDLAQKIDIGDLATSIDFDSLANEFNTSELAKEIVVELDYNRIIAALRKQPVVEDSVPTVDGQTTFNAAQVKALTDRVAKLEETLTRMSGVLNDER
jgi:hypothetical protein